MFRGVLQDTLSDIAMHAIKYNILKFILYYTILPTTASKDYIVKLVHLKPQLNHEMLW